MSNTILSNRLADETSPYLLQHAHNPVDWFPWSDEAFEKAKAEDKPVFLSIGYSTCHWCHVMERESFEKEEVARLMNETFINIKVDREERPDIDGVYMSVCQALTGSGGWPLTIVMTPDKYPFFAATYIPRKSQYGRIGMLEFIPEINKLWKENRKKVLGSAKEISSLLIKQEKKKWQNGMLKGEVTNESIEDLFKKTFEELQIDFDNEYGGFGSAPKFPTPHRISFLLRYWKRTKDSTAIEMVSKTLNNMRMGGLFDQIGFGFHRYSTDQKWLLPHFEKMLYDQALLAISYMEAYQATKEEVHMETAKEILEYTIRDLMDEKGGFYCAEDADSEGEEGKFYLWTQEEFDDVLKDKSQYAKEYFSIQSEGNFRDESTGKLTGSNILHLNAREKLVMIDKEKISDIRQILFNEREKRIRPSLDDKILTDWNGMIIRALAMAGRIFDIKEYTRIAEKAADLILNGIEEKGGLLHSYSKAKLDISANIDDYSFFIDGIIELYQATFNEDYIKKAIDLMDRAIDLFWDKEAAGFYFTAENERQLFIRKKELYDGAIPSGNSVMLGSLIKLSSLSDREDFSDKAMDMIGHFIGEIDKYPTGYTQMICGLTYAYGESGEITITGDLKQEETKEMLKNISQEFLPNILLKHSKSTGMPTATLCLNKTCGEATSNIQDILSKIL